MFRETTIRGLGCRSDEVSQNHLDAHFIWNNDLATIFVLQGLGGNCIYHYTIRHGVQGLYPQHQTLNPKLEAWSVGSQDYPGFKASGLVVLGLFTVRVASKLETAKTPQCCRGSKRTKKCFKTLNPKPENLNP